MSRARIVTDVDQDSNSAEAGLQKGDVIVEINRQPVTDAESAIKLVHQGQGQPDSSENLAAQRRHGRHALLERGQYEERVKCEVSRGLAAKFIHDNFLRLRL